MLFYGTCHVNLYYSIHQDYTPRMLFDLANAFFLDLGLLDLKSSYVTPCDPTGEKNDENIECYSNHPRINQPQWKAICHPMAFDMYAPTKDDYR